MSRRVHNRSRAPVEDAKSTVSTTAPGNANWKVVITTAAEVNVWNTNDKCDTIFNSQSEGIVAAKIAKDGNVLAVAGSQVVVLHKIERGQPRSYKLKGVDAQSRLLEYAADGKNLFITSQLRNCIQTYNVREDKIADTLKTHPSPITSFSSSPDSTLLLSCSSNPPTIHIDNLSLRTSAQLKPKCSSHKVILSCFHPTRKNIFLLAFSDGVLGAFDYTKCAKTGQHIHAFGHLHDAMIGGTGITGAEFIPGSQTRAVTVGEDGKLFVVDFDQKDVLGTHLVGAPITSIDIRAAETGSKGQKWYAAIGTIHGWCYIIDQDGKKISEMCIDRDGNKIRDVKWMSGEIRMPPTGFMNSPVQKRRVSVLPAPANRTPGTVQRQRPAPSRNEPPIVPAEKPEVPILYSVSKRGSTSPLLKRASDSPALRRKPVPIRPPEEQKPAVDKFDEEGWEDIDAADVKEIKPAWEDLQSGITADYMSVFSPLKQQPRRSIRLSIRSMDSPGKGGNTEDRISKLIKQDQEGLLRSSFSSPTLADGPKTMSKRREADLSPTVMDGISEPLWPMAGPSKSIPETALQDQPAKREPARKEKRVKINEPIKKQETLKSSPPKGEISRKPLPAPPPAVEPSSEPATEAKLLSDFRTLRAKVEASGSGSSLRGGKSTLSLFAPYLPNAKPAPKRQVPVPSIDEQEDKENMCLPSLSRDDTKAERKKAKAEEKERRKSSRAEKKRKQDSKFPAVSQLVLQDDDMDVDIKPSLGSIAPIRPSQSPGSLKRKAEAEDQYSTAEKTTDVPSKSTKSLKGKQRDTTPALPDDQDIWMSEEVTKPSKRVNFGPLPISSTSIYTQRHPSTSNHTAPKLETNMPPPVTVASDNTSTTPSYINDLKNTFKLEIQDLRIEMLEQFRLQTATFKQIMKEQEGENQRLRMENDRLKGQLGRR